MIKKIFIGLGTVVGCVILVATALNILLPNAYIAVVSAGEDMLYNATGIAFDFNGDGRKGSGTSNTSGYGAEVENSNNEAEKGAGVKGFQKN